VAANATLNHTTQKSSKALRAYSNQTSWKHETVTGDITEEWPPKLRHVMVAIRSAAREDGLRSIVCPLWVKSRHVRCTAHVRFTPNSDRKRFTMEFAQSGEMALQRIADAAGVSLILILSDINMPGMTGLELLPKAKAARPDVPVIMITAYGDADTKRKALEGGAEALFTKPIDFGALRSEITTRVERAA
jgi:CheY-like chemotaxis protein